MAANGSKKLRILGLCAQPPYPLTDGGRIATFETIRRLAASGHDLQLLTFGRSDDPGIAGLAGVCPVQVVAHGVKARLHPPLGSLISSLPYSNLKFESEQMARRIGRGMGTGRLTSSGSSIST